MITYADIYDQCSAQYTERVLQFHARPIPKHTAAYTAFTTGLLMIILSDIMYYEGRW